MKSQVKMVAYLDFINSRSQAIKIFVRLLELHLLDSVSKLGMFGHMLRSEEVEKIESLAEEGLKWDFVHA